MSQNVALLKLKDRSVKQVKIGSCALNQLPSSPRKNQGEPQIVDPVTCPASLQLPSPLSHQKRTLSTTSSASTTLGLSASIILTSFLPNHAKARIFSPEGSANCSTSFEGLETCEVGTPGCSPRALPSRLAAALLGPPATLMVDVS